MFTGSTFFDRYHRGIGIFVACPGAITQFGNRIVGVSKFLMLTRVIVVGMASRAIRCISGVLIRYSLRICFVAIDAIKLLRVRSRITGARMLVVQHRQPSGRTMTVNAFYCCHKMVGSFTRGFGAIVASSAISGDICMVECRRQPSHRLVTIATVSRCRNMGRRFARRFGSVMAAGARAQRLAVIHADRRPGRGNVAAVALIR